MTTAQQVLDLVDDILTNHHVPLKAEMPRMSTRLTGEAASVFSELRMLLEGHLMKEETILFPNIQGLARGLDVDGCGLIGPIRQMRHEHAQIHALEERLRALAAQGGPGSDELTALLDDLAAHADKEDSQLFPMAFALAGMPEPDWEGLDEEEELRPAAPRVVTPSRPQPRQEAKPAEKPRRRSRLRRLLRKVRG